MGNTPSNPISSLTSLTGNIPGVSNITGIINTPLNTALNTS